MLFLHIHMYFALCYFYRISFVHIFFFFKSTKNYKLSGQQNMKHRKKLVPLYFSTLQIHIVCSLKLSKWIFYLWNGNRWSPFKNNGERRANKISIFYSNLNQSHQALKVQMENTTVKFQGTLHPKEGEVSLFYFALDWALVTRAAGRRSCMAPASKPEIIIIRQLIEVNLVNFISMLMKLRRRN